MPPGNKFAGSYVAEPEPLSKGETYSSAPFNAVNREIPTCFCYVRSETRNETKSGFSVWLGTASFDDSLAHFDQELERRGELQLVWEDDSPWLAES